MGFWTSKKVLVTGGGGFLGSAVVDRLHALGCTAVLAPRRAEYDLRTADGVKRAFDAIAPDIVFHLAALVGGIRANIENPGRFFYDNSMMNLLVIEEARERGVEKLATVGSICAYPRRMEVPLHEARMWDGYPEETNAPYGISKRLSWVQLDAYRKQYGLNGIYLVPASMYGPRDCFDLANSHVLPALIKKCLDAKDRNEPSISIWGTGTARREFYYVEDAAETIVKAAEVYDSPNPLNIGSGVETSIAEAATLVAELTGYKGRLEFDHSKPDGEPRRLFDSSTARALLGDISKTNLREGLEKTIQWYREYRA